MKDDLKIVLQGVYKRAVNRYLAGKVKTTIGTHGYLVLMNDKIERILAGDETVGEKEIRELAVDAILALYYSVDIKAIDERIANPQPVRVETPEKDVEAYDEDDDEDDDEEEPIE